MPESGSRLPGILFQNGTVEPGAWEEESVSGVEECDLHLEQGVLMHHYQMLDMLLASKDLSCL